MIAYETKEDSGGLLIRDCRSSDLARVYEIEKLSFEEPYPLSLFKDMLAEYPQGFRVADYNGLLEGYCAVTPTPDEGTMIIASIAVHPDFKKHGIAFALIKDAISRIKSLEPKTKRLVLQVSVDNIAAQKLYSKLGFMYKQGIKNYYGRSKDAFEMELELAA
ncbi:MAG: ribosomal protein S18-alanine N-acetyltransferase [Nitrososphaerota archaeon]|nr:ribosomal protein S18-alanine N-acetyltransferase [Nitrososphaerota archaeon]